MITSLQAQNFKSWKDTTPLKIAPLTGFFGTNSSGKTSLLQILLMLKQTAESSDRKRVLHTGDDRSLVDLGTFYDLLHRHDREIALQIALTWDLPKSLTIKDPANEKDTLFSISSLTYESSVIERSERPVVSYFGYRFDAHEFGMRLTGSKDRAKQDRYDLVHGDYSARRGQGRPWPLPSPVKCYGFPDEAVGYYQNTGFLPDFVLAFENQLSRVAYLGPLREYPQRRYVWAGERPVDVGRRGGDAIAALLAARAESMRTPRMGKTRRQYTPIDKRVAEWLKALGLIDSFTLRPIAENRKDYEVRVKVTGSSAEVGITDVGFGVSQILPVLVLCYYVPEGSTIILEQPEIHLHPCVQAGLADVLIEVVRERSVQVIVESHSEHLVRRLQRRIAEGTLGPKETALYFCAMDNGSSRVERLDVDLYGNIRNWPKGFLGDDMEDLAAMTNAAMARRRSETS